MATPAGRSAHEPAQDPFGAVPDVPPTLSGAVAPPGELPGLLRAPDFGADPESAAEDHAHQRGALELERLVFSARQMNCPSN